MTINFNGAIGDAASIDQIQAGFTRGKVVDASVVSVSGNTIVVDLPAAQAGVENQHLVNVIASMGPNDYEITFASSDKYSDEGLE